MAVILLCAVIFTTTIVSVLLTVVVGMAIKNQLMQRQLRELQYWQARAMRAEDPDWRQ
jgi:MFS superfamily sulfate permease-like transporter